MPETVSYHVACHLQAQNAGLRSRDLLKAAGVKCTLVQRCSGIDGTWGYRLLVIDDLDGNQLFFNYPRET